MKTSIKFATSPHISVAKGKNSVAMATVLVTISSPVQGHKIMGNACKTISDEVYINVAIQ